MDPQLRGKQALVTGSTAGIGIAAAAGLFKEGVYVVVNGRASNRLNRRGFSRHSEANDPIPG